MMKRIRMICVTAVLVLLLANASFAAAISPQQTAAAYLCEAGIMVGNEHGDMMLDQGLTRAQMATLVTHIAVNIEHVEADSTYYRSRCNFVDVPDWAKVYVGYCAANYLVAGYGDDIYGSNDPVTPAAACTVMLRCLGDVGVNWNYDTACQTAIDLGLASPDILAGTEITRGNMAVLIYHTMEKMGHDMKLPNSTDAPDPHEPISYNADGSINIPSDGSRHVPQAGDVIRCDDGTNYIITDMSRYDSNVFASGPVGELPTATCEWSNFPDVALPDAEVRHFITGGRDTLFIRNLYETRRMQYTLYNALGRETSAWSGDTPLATVQLSIPAELEAYTYSFWPWRSSELEELVQSRPNSQYYAEAWDYYLDGVFQYTRYCVVSL